MQREQEEDTLSFSQIFGVISRNSFYLVLWMVLCAGLGFIIAHYIPAKYKSKAVLSIQSSYFQHPLVSELIADVVDPGEMSSQRQALLRLALNDQFLDAIAQKYSLYKYPTDPAKRPLEREMLLKKIEYFSVSPTTFQIAIATKNPTTSYNVTRDILTQMTFTLTEQRYQNFLKARDSILKQAQLLKTTLSNAPTAQQQELESQLAAMEANLASLRSRFTDSHPDVVAARGKAQALRSRVQRRPPEVKPEVDEYSNVFLSPASRAPSQDIFNDLLKKLSHLNIVLAMEGDRQRVSYLSIIEQPSVPTQPYFPNPIQFAIFGALAGAVLAAIRITFIELERAKNLTSEQASIEYGFELLGELPYFELKKPTLMIPDLKRAAVAFVSSPTED